MQGRRMLAQWYRTLAGQIPSMQLPTDYPIQRRRNFGTGWECVVGHPSTTPVLLLWHARNLRARGSFPLVSFLVAVICRVQVSFICAPRTRTVRSSGSVPIVYSDSLRKRLLSFAARESATPSAVLMVDTPRTCA